MAGVFDGDVGLEHEVGDHAQAEGFRHLAAQVGDGALERREKLGDVTSSEAGDEGGGALEVGADPDFGDRQVGAGEIRVAKLRAREDVRQNVTDLFGDAELALGRRARRRTARLHYAGTSSIS